MNYEVAIITIIVDKKDGIDFINKITKTLDKTKIYYRANIEYKDVRKP